MCTVCIIWRMHDSWICPYSSSSTLVAIGLLVTSISTCSNDGIPFMQVKTALDFSLSDQSRSSLLNKLSGGTIPGAVTDGALSLGNVESPVMPTIVGSSKFVVGVAFFLGLPLPRFGSDVSGGGHFLGLPRGRFGPVGIGLGLGFLFLEPFGLPRGRLITGAPSSCAFSGKFFLGRPLFAFPGTSAGKGLSF